MTKFEFVLNKFYEITAWSLFAAVAMTTSRRRWNGSASILADSVLSF